MGTEPKTTSTPAATLPDRSLLVRFAKVETKSANPKAPTHRYNLVMPFPFKGLILEGPIFTATDSKGGKEYSVSVPGGSFRALKADKVRLTSGDKEYVLNDDDPEGVALLDRWDPAIKAGFLEFLRTGKSEQRITL